MSAVATLTRLARCLFVAPAPARGQVSPDLLRLSRLLRLPPSILLGFRPPGRPEARYHYCPFSRAKRDGGRRRIYAPSPDLKALQRTLLRRYLDRLPVHPAVTGFRPGFSVADHARAHLGQAVVVTADVEDFFDRTPAHRVRAFFRAQGWDAVAAAVLTGLCTFRGALPQGAPTSPALSNLVNVPLDEALSALARRSGGLYTRYGDDLAFSWPTGAVPSDLEANVRAELLALGYCLNPVKGWRVWRVDEGDVPCVTGVHLGHDGCLHPDPTLEREMARLRRRTRFRDDRAAAACLRGYEGFVGMLAEK